MKKYSLELNSFHWECGDGCCSDYLTEVFVNGVEIGTYSFFYDHEALYTFIEMLNENTTNLVYKCTPIADEEGLWEYITYWNDMLLGRLEDWTPFHDILKYFKLNYKYLEYDVDWDIWRKEERFVIDVDYVDKNYEF